MPASGSIRTRPRTTKAALAMMAGLGLIGLAQAPTHAQTVNIQTAEVWVLPDFDPYQSNGIDWFNGNGIGKWSDGYPLIGEPSSFFLDFEMIDNLQSYIELGQTFATEENLQSVGNQGTASHQLVTSGSLDFSADVSNIPTSFADDIALSRTAPDFFDPLGLTGLTITGDDAAFFGHEPAGLPDTVAGDSFALDLLFTGTEHREYNATLEIQTDTPGLVIPFEITGSIVPEPASVALILLG